ncbi:substrate-binding domain-containing protein [Nocardioides sp. R-C-SC26]|uniref:substrate-binding domain-containing protein n=1 Tax=Nocardioides sp. R-C-SC26 TaxID=2870414 RepID=UPI001E44C690|nr:Ig-like domain repeat protein [Nocardioides sp. R-C-SC26]
MSVRTSFVGLVTAAVAGSALVLSAGAAHAADPDDTTFTPAAADLIGAGSDTSQHAMFLVANAYNATTPAPAAKIATFAATGGGDIALPSGAIKRPNGSGAGKALLYGAGNNTDIDYARSSSSLSTAETAAGLQQFPFAVDVLKMAVSNTTASNAPTSLTPAQIVSIYKGDVTNWSQIGGKDGAIKPLIPQTGSGTRSFFISQLQAANNGVAVQLASSVAEVQEHDDSKVKSDANAIAPFSAGRAGLLGTTLRLLGGFEAKRALYNVVRQADLGKAEVQAAFGPTGFVCSEDARELIVEAGFDQLASQADGGACGVATQATTSNFKISEAPVAIPTTTSVTSASAAPRALRLVAKVAGTPTPTGTVAFSSGETTLGTASLIGGTATLNLTGATPGSYPVTATYTPAADSDFVTSAGTTTAVVTTSSTVKAAFAKRVKASAKKVTGTVTVSLSGVSSKATGKVVVVEGSKVVGSGNLSGGKATITLTTKKLGAGKSNLIVVWGGNSIAAGSSAKFAITVTKK